MLQSRHLSQKIRGQSQKNVSGRTFPANLPKFILIIYGLLKMSQGQQLPDPDPELINAKSLDFAKPKLFFKNIGRYAATSTYIHVRIPFNFSQILDTKATIEQQYQVLLDKHEDPFKTIAKTTTDMSLLTISASIEDFQDVIKALPQTIANLTTGPSQTVHCSWHCDCSCRSQLLQCLQNHRTEQRDLRSQIKNKSTSGCFSPS